jgi:hypothetical protein
MLEEKESHVSTKQKIEAWLEAEGITFESVSDFNAHYHLVANLKNIQVHLSEPKVRKGVLAVQAVASLDEPQLWKANQISPEDKRSIFISLFSKLDRSEYLFMLQEDLTSKSWLRIQRTLYIEEISRTSVLREMKDLNVKFVDVNYVLNEALDIAPKAVPEETIYK